MKTTVLISFEFRGGKGHAYVNIVVSDDYGIDKIDKTGALEYELGPGSYRIMFEGVSPSKGTTVTLYVNDAEKNTIEIPEGPFSERFKFKIEA